MPEFTSINKEWKSSEAHSASPPTTPNSTATSDCASSYVTAASKRPTDTSIDGNKPSNAHSATATGNITVSEHGLAVSQMEGNWRPSTQTEKDTMDIIREEGQTWNETKEQIPGHEPNGCSKQRSKKKSTVPDTSMPLKKKREYWRRKEDEILKKHATQFGGRNIKWARIAGLFPVRSNKACKKRWYRKLRPSSVGQQLEDQGSEAHVGERPSMLRADSLGPSSHSQATVSQASNHHNSRGSIPQEKSNSVQGRDPHEE